MKFATEIWHFYKSILPNLVPMSLIKICIDLYSRRRPSRISKRLRAYLVKRTETWPMFWSLPSLEACSDGVQPARLASKCINPSQLSFVCKLGLESTAAARPRPAPAHDTCQFIQLILCIVVKKIKKIFVMMKNHCIMLCRSLYLTNWSLFDYVFRSVVPIGVASCCFSMNEWDQARALWLYLAVIKAVLARFGWSHGKLVRSREK